MRTFVGVTDEKWYRFLAARPGLTEVNFWRPSGGGFRALTPGEPFFFKAHYPLNRIVGGGFFSGFTQLRISEAWELFGEANGVASLDEMRRSVGRYRKQPIGLDEDPIIGCIFVRDSVFFPEDSTVDPPPGFASNVVQGKTYELVDPTVAGYFDLLLHRLLGVTVELDDNAPWHRPGPVYGDPRLVPQRLGQQSFKAVVLGAYARALRDHREQGPACVASGSHSATAAGWRASDRQRPAAQVGRPHPLRSGIPGSRPEVPVDGQPSIA